MVENSMEPFDPSDPFDVATEAVRKDIAEVIHRHWVSGCSSEEQQVMIQAILTALTVSLAFMLKSVSDAPDAILAELVSNSLPSAFATADGIIEDNVGPMEVRH